MVLWGAVKKSELILNVALVPVDFIMLLLAGIVTYLIRTRILDTFRPVEFSFNLPFERYFIFVFVVAIVFIIAYASSGLYALRTTRRLFAEVFRVAIASSAGLMAVIIYIFLRAELFGVHKNAQDDKIIFQTTTAQKRTVAVVQRPHRGNKADGLSS